MAKNVQFITVNYNKLSSKGQIGGANLEETTVVSVDDDEAARVNEGCRVSSKSPSLARAVEEVVSKETDKT